jgi:hypothetical protein
MEREGAAALVSHAGSPRRVVARLWFKCVEVQRLSAHMIKVWIGSEDHR